MKTRRQSVATTQRQSASPGQREGCIEMWARETGGRAGGRREPRMGECTLHYDASREVFVVLGSGVRRFFEGGEKPPKSSRHFTGKVLISKYRFHRESFHFTPLISSARRPSAVAWPDKQTWAARVPRRMSSSRLTRPHRSPPQHLHLCRCRPRPHQEPPAQHPSPRSKKLSR